MKLKVQKSNVINRTSYYYYYKIRNKYLTKSASNCSGVSNWIGS